MISQNLSITSPRLGSLCSSLVPKNQKLPSFTSSYSYLYCQFIIVCQMKDEGINDKFHSMGVLLLLDCPDGLEFGIDNIAWKTGTKFKGLKLIPLGTHIIAYSLQSENNMFKISHFVHLSEEKRILIHRWNAQVQQFLEVKGEEAEGYRCGVTQYHFDSHLGPYPADNLQFWSQTTRYITKPVLAKLDPIDKLQQFQHEYSSKPKPNEEQQMAKLSLDDSDGQNDCSQEADQPNEQPQEQKGAQNPGKFKPLSDTIYYSLIPRKMTASPNKITEMNMDKTPILLKVLQRQWHNQQEHLLGQLQYSFIHFVIGECEESLEQWKKIIDLLIHSQSAYLRLQIPTPGVNLQKLMLDFIPVIYDQLNQFPIDFFRDELSKGSFICHGLTRLKEYTGHEYSPKIAKRIEKLLQLVKHKFDFVVEEEELDPEDLPAVVDEGQHYF